MSKQVFAGEVQLIAWGESNNSGAWIKLQISAEDLEAFRDLKTRSGKVSGQVLMAVMMEPEEDGQAPSTPAAAAPAPPPPAGAATGPLCVLAVRWCRYDEFQKWCASQWMTPAPDEVEVEQFTDAQCKQTILNICGVTSRKAIDSNDVANVAFNEFIRGPFSKHLIARGIVT